MGREEARKKEKKHVFCFTVTAIVIDFVIASSGCAPLVIAIVIHMVIVSTDCASLVTVIVMDFLL